jgi:hypothetical protein
LITDGYTAVNHFEVGGIAGNIYGSGLGSEMGFKHLVRICNEMKKNDIEIYSIYLTGNNFFKSFANECASSADHYFINAPSFDVFAKALENIGNGDGTGNEQVRLIR